MMFNEIRLLQFLTRDRVWHKSKNMYDPESIFRKTPQNRYARIHTDSTILTKTSLNRYARIHTDSNKVILQGSKSILTEDANVYS